MPPSPMENFQAMHSVGTGRSGNGRSTMAEQSRFAESMIKVYTIYPQQIQLILLYLWVRVEIRDFAAGSDIMGKAGCKGSGFRQSTGSSFSCGGSP